ncbi:hypothetical protein PR002_g20336 [Phytophthora rubi]|uniref:Uncharacterized protein n=1 Tax=Phytophthora rubi TaxID=129364 RepID=A0A6A3JCX6_9STRA|nr:hypothetical protein PR002_g20336 [Phytophthora rubi]
MYDVVHGDEVGAVGSVHHVPNGVTNAGMLVRQDYQWVDGAAVPHEQSLFQRVTNYGTTHTKFPCEALLCHASPHRNCSDAL